MVEMPGERGPVPQQIVAGFAQARLRQHLSGEGKTAAAQRDVTIERLHGSGVQRNRPFRAGLKGRDAQLASPRTEIGELQLACFTRANAGARQKADECLIRDRMQRAILRRECVRPPQDRTNLRRRVDVRSQATVTPSQRPGGWDLRAWIER